MSDADKKKGYKLAFEFDQARSFEATQKKIDGLNNTIIKLSEQNHDLRSVVRRCFENGYIPINTQLFSDAREIYGAAAIDNILKKRRRRMK